MKRNVGLSLMALFQFLNMVGINIDIQQADIDSMGTALGGIIAGIGVIHDIARKTILKYLAKK